MSMLLGLSSWSFWWEGNPLKKWHHLNASPLSHGYVLLLVPHKAIICFMRIFARFIVQFLISLRLCRLCPSSLTDQSFQISLILWLETKWIWNTCTKYVSREPPLYDVFREISFLKSKFVPWNPPQFACCQYHHVWDHAVVLSLLNHLVYSVDLKENNSRCWSRIEREKSDS